MIQFLLHRLYKAGGKKMKKKKWIVSVMGALVWSFLMTGILLAAAAFLLWKTDLSPNMQKNHCTDPLCPLGGNGRICSWEDAKRKEISMGTAGWSSLFSDFAPYTWNLRRIIWDFLEKCSDGGRHLLHERNFRRNACLKGQKNEGTLGCTK